MFHFCNHFLTVKNLLCVALCPPGTSRNFRAKNSEVLMRVNWPQPGRRWHRNVSCVTGGIRGAATFPLRRSSVAAPGEYQATEAKNTYVSHTYVYIYIDCFFSLRSTWYEWKSLICKYIVIILTFCATDLPRALRKLGDFHSMEVLLGCYF